MADTLHLQTGEYLFKQGERGGDMFIIQDGQVRVFKTEAGIDIELDTISKGSFVGEVSALDGGQRSASVVALQPTELVRVDKAKFDSIRDKMPDWFQKIAVILVQRLREVDKRIDLSTAHIPLQQVAGVVALVASDHTDSEPIKFERKLLERELSDLLCISFQDIDSYIQQLAHAGYIEADNASITILSLPALEAYFQQLGISTPEKPVT